MKAQEIALKVLRKHWKSSVLPVEPLVLAKSLGVELAAGAEDDTSVKVYVKNRKWNVEYNGKDSTPLQRMAVAWGLGHLFLGQVKDHPVEGSREFVLGGSYDALNVDAHRFAMELVMPGHSMRTAVVERGITSLAKLCSLFEVSEKTMHQRLRSLGYIS